ncbi:MAG: hemolysin family protein [Oscillospiraceae bacterium]|nr:hemolysin family protein [Oscillospiraceae bacterium]
MLEPVMNQIIMWLSMIILIVFSAFFSSSETAFSSLNRIRIKKMAADGNKHAKKVLKLNDEYTRVLTGVLIGNNIVNIAASTISTLLFTMYFGTMGAGISTIVLTIVILIFGEVIPKTIARDRAEFVCMKSSGIIHFFTIIFTPIIFVFDKIKNIIDKTDDNDKKPTMTEQELKFVIDEIEYQGILEDHEGELVRSALDLDETTAEKAMTPRVDLVSIEVDSDIEDVRDIFLNEKYSRLPVYKKDIDNVIGILSEKDFLRAYLSGDKFTISDLVKKAPLVPPQMNISDLMVKFQKGKPHMAIVVDQYGGVEGIICL